MKRKILLPIEPIKTELQKKADEYEQLAFDELCLDVKRYEHLDEGLILFLYSDFSITKIRQYHQGGFRVESYQNTRCPSKSSARTVGDTLNEKWNQEQFDTLHIQAKLKRFAVNWN